MDRQEMKGIIEGILFASGDEGVTIQQIAQVLDVSEIEIIDLLDELTHDFKDRSRGVRIMQSNETFYLTTKPEHSLYYEKLLSIPYSSKLSQAALETLAIIAYKQPITRAEIEHIRGVNSERPLRTLLRRSLIEEVGRKEAIGRPILFGTSKDFLAYFGLTSLNELPELPEDFDPQEIEKEAEALFREKTND